MAGFANLFVLGQPNPEQQLASLLSGQQQPGQPQGAGPPGASPAPGGPGADPPAAPGAPPPPGSQPLPTGLQSTPDMSASYAQLAQPPNIMSLYMQMQRRDQAMSGINNALATIVANHSPPSMRQSIMQGIGGGGGDAGGMVNNLMSLYSFQQQQAAQQAMLAQAPAIDKRNNWPDGTARVMIMAGHGPEVIRSMEPTEQQKNIQWQHDQFVKNGGSEDEWRKTVLPTVMMASLPGMTPDYMSYMKEAQNWGQTHPGQPVPDFVQWKNVVAQEQATTKEKQDTVTGAQGQMGSLLGPLTSMEGKVNTLQDAFNTGKLDALFSMPPTLIKAIAESPSLSAANSAASSILSSLGLPSLTQAQVNLAKNIYELTGQDKDTMHALGPTSGRNIAPQFETIGSKLGPVGDLSRGKEDWGKALEDLRDNILKGEAHIYGGANITPQGEDAHVNEILKRMPDQYLAGGAMNLRTPMPIPSDEAAKAVAMLKQHPEQASTIFHVLQAQNYDTKDLQQRFQQGLK